MKLPNLIQRLRWALEEDMVNFDVTTRAIPGVHASKLEAVLMAKASGVLSGVFLAPLIYKHLDKGAHVRFLKKDGDHVKPGDRVAVIRCSASALLGGERTLLNLLCHLSGIATLTRQYVQAVKGTSAKIVDTRKTTPLWRDLEKFAVVCGGGANHRFSLGDAVLVKDNHQQLLRDKKMSVESLYGIDSKTRRQSQKLLFVAIEATTLAEVWEAILARPDIILLDNMPLNRLKASIEFIQAAREALKSSKPFIEVSGGVTIEKAKIFANLGVDRISVGALTHSAPTLDFSLEVL